jgi:hypothetical protein
MPADVEQGEDQRGELVPHRQSGEDGLGPRIVDRADRERGLAGIGAIGARGDLVREDGDFLDQILHLDRLGAAVEAGDQLDRTAQVAEVLLERGGGGSVENGHGLVSQGKVRACRKARGGEREMVKGTLRFRLS